MNKTKKSCVVRATYGTVRSLGAVVGASCCLVKGVGRSIGAGCRILTGGTTKILTMFSRAPKQSNRKGQSLTPREQIRAVVIEELARSLGAERKTALAGLEERLQLMADTIEAIQKEIFELSGRGLEHEALVSTAMASVENVGLLNDEEKAILTNIFRQNVEIQKPNLVEAAVGRA
jgi:hypothetical protein